MARMLLLVGLLCSLGLANGIPGLGLTSNLFPAEESCDPSLSASECQLRKAECGVVNSILQATGGPINAVLDCAETVGVPINPAAFATLGTGYLTSAQPSVVEHLGTDPTSLAALRYCTLNATGLVKSNGMIDRVELIERFQTQLYYVPSVSSALVEAANLCPEPTEYKMEPLLACLRASCLQAGVPLPLSAEDLNPTPKKDLTLSSLPTSVPLDTGFWMM